MKQVHIPDFLNNISTDCDTLLMQHYSITVRWQRKCTCNIGCMLQVGSHLAYSTPPKTSQPVDHVEAPGESGVGIFHVVESLHWGMIWTMGEWASQEIIMKKVNFPLDCQALFFLQCCTWFNAPTVSWWYTPVKGIDPPLYRWDKTAPCTSAWSISLHDKSEWKVMSVELHKTIGLHKALCDFSIA